MNILFFITALVASLSIVLAQDDRLYSYICLSAQDKLCLAISTSQPPKYDASDLYFLQVKLREKIQVQGQDYLKTRWSVLPSTSQIQLSNFTSLCIAKRRQTAATPDDVVLRPCGGAGNQELWALEGFLKNETIGSTLRLKSLPNQCLTLMNCKRTNGFCSKDSTTAFSGTSMDPENLKGAYMRMMPCSPSLAIAQSFTQTVDCAPGCSPLLGKDDVCDDVCANAACNWDNGACVTQAPTPPTMEPTKSPTTQRPSRNPSTTKPSRSPTGRPSPAGATIRPSPQVTSSPTLRTASPTGATAQPTPSPESPTTTSASPTVTSASPTATTVSPTAPTTQSPTGSRGVQTGSPTLGVVPTDDASNASSGVGRRLWYVWLIIIVILVILLLLCCCWGFGLLGKKKSKEDGATPLGKDDEDYDYEGMRDNSQEGIDGGKAQPEGAVMPEKRALDEPALEAPPAKRAPGGELEDGYMEHNVVEDDTTSGAAFEEKVDEPETAMVHPDQPLHAHSERR